MITKVIYVRHLVESLLKHICINGEIMSTTTVKDTIDNFSDTGMLSGLSAQIIEKFSVIVKAKLGITMADFSDLSHLAFLANEPGHKVNTFLQEAAKKSLQKAIQDHPEKDPIFINSAYRTVAQQYFLRQLFLSRRGSSANKPGTSSHEDGLALDIRNHDEWKDALINNGWVRPFLPKEPWHFSFQAGTNSDELKKIGVEAFQELWNEKNPTDQIEVDGDFGKETKKRMDKSPPNGF
jgi:D-alanyl-D-alanine carboxypeptidase